MTVRLVSFILLLLVSWAPVVADDYRVSLLTCDPGADIYELEGHTALRITGNGQDVVVNYGLFDFGAPNFVYRFVKGETDYMVGASPYEYFVSHYRRNGRAVREQEIDLTPEQTERLIALLQENLLPENRVYRYNYVKDNCATRPLAMLEKAIGDTLSLTAPAYTDGWTFRKAMRHYHRNYPWYQFGIDLALGSGIDYELTDREKAFAPVMLMEMLEGGGSVGTPMVVSPGKEGGAELGPTPALLSPLAVSLAVLLLVVLVAVYDIRRHKVTRWVDTVYFSVAGLAGCLLTFLIFVSTHEATSPNWLYLWLNPLCLIIPVCIYIKSLGKLVMTYEFVNFALILLLIVMWPWLRQSANIAFWPLMAADVTLTLRYIYIVKCYNPQKFG